MGITTRIDPLPEQPVRSALPGEMADRAEEAGLGTLRTERGNLPLRRLDLHADITGLSSAIRLTQVFRNTHDVPLEATYIFPLPDRAAVTGLSMKVAGRVVHAELQERAAARQAYAAAIAAGQRAGIAEEERPDVFTLRVGNILPGEEAVLEFTLAGPLPLVDGQAEFRFPLVVAPRYIPGAALAGPDVGSGWATDTNLVPDASRITPPTLLPGFPNPVDLSIEARIDPAGLELAGVASSLHAVTADEDGVLRILPGERVDRDFILRLDYTGASDSLILVPDEDGGEEGTYQLTVMPPEPEPATARPRPKDLMLVLDRSGSMGGWKMVAARRAATRIIDTLTDIDRFGVILFDHSLESPDGLPDGLVAASDRHRFRAVEHLARADARGGTEMLAPLRTAAHALAAAAAGASGAASRDRVLVLVTDGQVGDEDHILRELTPLLSGARVHTVGIDRAVNAGFLGRLAAIGGGRCELVESEDRLDEAMERIHRRIGSPTVTRLRVEDAGGLTTDPESAAGPGRLTALFPGVPLVRSGRYQGTATGALTVSGLTSEGRPWSRTVRALVAHDRPEVGAIWARARLRDLEDRCTVRTVGRLERDALEQEIVRISLRHRVLCRFTAYVAIDEQTAVADGTAPHEVTQLVEPPAGWISLAEPARPAQPMPRAAGRRQAAGMPRPDGAFDRVPGQSTSSSVDPSAPEFPAAAPMAPAAPSPVASMPAPPPPSPAMQSPLVPGPAPFDDERHMARAWAAAREQSATEARLLRESADEPAFRRRDLLDDLASRLDALVLHMERALKGSVDILRQLITVLRDEHVSLDERWNKALVLLDRFATEPEQQERPQPGAERRAFWKRG